MMFEPHESKELKWKNTFFVKIMIKNPLQPRYSIFQQSKKSNWRAKHEAFRQMIRAAKSDNPVQLEVDPNPDYVSCPSCQRRFQEESAKRHIPICKEKAAKKALERQTTSRGAISGTGKDKAEELRRRTAYKPPSPRKAKK
jgi:endogenous inhibitor of DNA gyrase (YacG/DUF329 family)